MTLWLVTWTHVVGYRYGRDRQVSGAFVMAKDEQEAMDRCKTRLAGWEARALCNDPIVTRVDDSGGVPSQFIIETFTEAE